MLPASTSQTSITHNMLGPRPRVPDPGIQGGPTLYWIRPPAIPSMEQWPCVFHDSIPQSWAPPLSCTLHRQAAYHILIQDPPEVFGITSRFPSLEIELAEIVYVFILKQGFSNSESPCLGLLSASVTGMGRHAWLCSHFCVTPHSQLHSLAWVFWAVYEFIIIFVINLFEAQLPSYFQGCLCSHSEQLPFPS